MEYKQILNIAVLAGEIMLRSGAETYRVEDTMKHILNTARTEVAEAFVMMTGIVATLDNPDMEMLTAMRRVHDRGTNMHRIVQVNEISSRYCRGEVWMARLKHRRHSRSPISAALAIWARSRFS